MEAFLCLAFEELQENNNNFVIIQRNNENFSSLQRQPPGMHQHSRFHHSENGLVAQ